MESDAVQDKTYMNFDSIYASIMWMKQHGVAPSHILMDRDIFNEAVKWSSHYITDIPPCDPNCSEMFGIKVDVLLGDGKGWRVVCDSSSWN